MAVVTASKVTAVHPDTGVTAALETPLYGSKLVDFAYRPGTADRRAVLETLGAGPRHMLRYGAQGETASGDFVPDITAASTLIRAPRLSWARDGSRVMAAFQASPTQLTLVEWTLTGDTLNPPAVHHPAVAAGEELVGFAHYSASTAIVATTRGVYFAPMGAAMTAYPNVPPDPGLGIRLADMHLGALFAATFAPPGSAPADPAQLTGIVGEGVVIFEPLAGPTHALAVSNYFPDGANATLAVVHEQLAAQQLIWIYRAVPRPGQPARLVLDRTISALVASHPVFWPGAGP
jgi:hypothetical protein